MESGVNKFTAIEGGMRKKRILFCLGDTAGCAHYRILMPVYALLQTERYDCKATMLINKEKYDWDPDIIVVSRQHKPEVLVHLKRWQSMGKKIIYDIDDNLINIYPTNPAYKIFQGIKKEVIAVMKTCDLITVSTKPLVDVYKHINSNIKILPNQILPGYAQLRKRNTTNKIRIGWAGSNTHLTDFSMANYGILEVAKRRDDVKFIFFGYMPPEISKAFTKNGQLDSEKIEFHKSVPINEYHLKLSLLGLDIGLAPLHDNKFNECKSNLKVLEYGVLGVPTIASPVYPYSTTINSGVDGIVVKKDKNWDKEIEELVVNKDLRERMGKTIQSRVLKEFNAITNVELWEKTYLSVLEEK